MSLDARYCWLDTWAFEWCLDGAEAAVRDSQEARARALAERGLGLYGGPFLGKDAGEPWAVSLRERLRRRFLRASGRLGGRLEAAGQWDAAIDRYEAALDVDGLAEAFYQRLMVCHARLGRRAEALAVYTRCRDTLAAGLDVAPSAETEALHRTLRGGPGAALPA